MKKLQAAMQDSAGAVRGANERANANEDALASEKAARAQATAAADKAQAALAQVRSCPSRT